MPDFSTVEDTLFVPMLGRIYASENFPHILHDKKALELKPSLPKKLKGQDTQTQYTLMASAVRSTNMDRYIKDFMKRYPSGIVVNLGCGLETTFFRNDDGKHLWYEVDLPAVINYRRELIGESEREKLIAADAFGEEWIKEIRKEHPTTPLIVAASGLFYYFTEEKVTSLFKQLKNYGEIEILFDTVNKSGMKQMSKYMKQVGHEEASMYFYVDKLDELCTKIGATPIIEEAYYAHTDKRGLGFVTKTSMRISDIFMMVKMEHFKIN